jgi:hypothetical protein
MLKISSIDSSVNFLNDVSDNKLTLGFFVLCCLPSSGAVVKNALIFTFALPVQLHDVVFRHRDHTTTVVSLIRIK